MYNFTNCLIVTFFAVWRSINFLSDNFDQWQNQRFWITLNGQYAHVALHLCTVGVMAVDGEGRQTRAASAGSSGGCKMQWLAKNKEIVLHSHMLILWRRYVTVQAKPLVIECHISNISISHCYYVNIGTSDVSPTPVIGCVGLRQHTVRLSTVCPLLANKPTILPLLINM